MKVDIAKNVDLGIRNNSHSIFYYDSRNGEVALRFEQQGDEEYIVFSELRKMRKSLENLNLVLYDTTETGHSILEVAKALHLEKVYHDLLTIIAGYSDNEIEQVDYLDADCFENFVLESDFTDFDLALQNEVLGKHIVLTTVELYQNGTISDMDKIEAIVKTRPVQERDGFLESIKRKASL